MKKLLLPKKMALYSKKIPLIHEMQKTHISPMSYMCFSNIEFANRILKYYLEFAEYSELSGNMIFLNLLKEREESGKEVQNFYVSSPIMYMVSRSLISLQYTVKRLQIKTAAENKSLYVNSFIKNENSREHMYVLRMLSFGHFSIVKEKEALFIPFGREGKIEKIAKGQTLKEVIYGKREKNWSQVNFIPAKQQKKWACLYAHLADDGQFVVGDLAVRNEAKKSRMQEWLFKSVRSYEEKKYGSLIGHVAVGKDIYFGKVWDRIQSGGEGKSDKFFSWAKFFAESSSKWNIYPIVNSVKVQREWYSGGILRAFWSKLAWDINQIEKIPPVQLDAPRNIQPDFYIRKTHAYALFAFAYATAQIEKFVQVREKGYANGIIDFVKYQIERSLNARNSRMAERKMLWQKNSWKEEVEEETHLWEKEINSLSLEKDRNTGRTLGNWSKEKRIYWNGIGNWPQKKEIYRNEIGNWSRKKQIYQNKVENWLQKKYIYWHEKKKWLEKKQIKQYEIESLPQINFIPAKQRAKWTCLHVHLATAARVKYPCCAGNLLPHQLAVGYLTPAKQRAKWTCLHIHLADTEQFVVGDLTVRNEAKKSRMQEWLFKFVRSYEEKKYRSLIGHVTVGKDMYSGKIQDSIQSVGEGKSDKFSSRVKFFAKPSGKWNVYPTVNSVKVQREWYSDGILGDFLLELALNINRIEKISPVQLDAPRSIQPDFYIRKTRAYALFASAYATAQIEKFVQVRERGYANRIIDFVKIGKSLNARNSRMAERKMLWQKNSWKEEVAEEETHLWEKEINSLSLYKDRDTGRKLGNWSKEKRIYWNGIGNWSQKKWIYWNEIGNWSRKNRFIRIR